jgi:outer membrane murein-binding lipoprotein Lpp
MPNEEPKVEELLARIAELEEEVSKLRKKNRRLKSDNETSQTQLTQSRAARWSR